jgi:hypothetical protein
MTPTGLIFRGAGGMGQTGKDAAPALELHEQTRELEKKF